MSELAHRYCKPCRGQVAPLGDEEREQLRRKLGGGWRLVDGHHLEKRFRFADFRQALAFVNRVGELAEAVDHHPDLHLAWGRVTLSIWTHKIDGLSETDFVFAAKVDELAQHPEPSS